MELLEIEIHGFKSIKHRVFKPERLSVLIGPNGAGKSNFISFFRMLSYLLQGELRVFVGQCGGASRLLFDGEPRTPQISVGLKLRTDKGVNEYAFRLAHAAGDTLLFLDEKYRFSRAEIPSSAPWIELGAGHSESRLRERDDITARTLRSLLQKIVVHQFHNTSSTARMRNKWSTSDSRWLKEDGGNLAAFLLRLRDEQSICYERIVSTLQNHLPFFGDFVLEPEYSSVLLRWKEIGSDVVFDASQRVRWYATPVRASRAAPPTVRRSAEAANSG